MAYEQLTTEQIWEGLRYTRNFLLAESDWTQLTDNGLTDSDRSAWQNYRTELRNLPANTIDPSKPDWPEKPSE
tara:strand:+ start:1168 stop:1386 length:219 start_codon:yes stop_codon:yes gene_type:complete